MRRPAGWGGAVWGRTPGLCRTAGLLLTLCAVPGAPLPAQGGSATVAEAPSPRVRTVQIAGRLPAPRPATVVLPGDYGTSGRRYPVLYLLHGHWGAHGDWLAGTNLLAYTEDLPAIVVLPDAGNSWYSNSAARPADRWEDYVADDVVAYVDRHFRTLRFPAARYVAGLSMGGYGALKLALKRPGRFGLAASFSGAFTTATDTRFTSLDSVFGPVGGGTRQSEELVELVRRAPTENPPFFYLDCGTSDRFLASNRAVAAALAERGFPYEYHEVPGMHSWEHWNARLPAVLALVRERIRALP